MGDEACQGLQLNAVVVQQLTTELEGIEVLSAESLLESVRNLKRQDVQHNIDHMQPYTVATSLKSSII